MKILVVEDENGIASFIKKALEEECYEVDVAPNGKEGYFLATTNEYDLIVSDYIMPEMNGREMCQKIREEEINIPILMLSVESETEKKIDLLDLGADDYITKPFKLEELLARIRALLRRPKAVQNEIIHVGKLSIDSKKNLIKIGEKEIDLTLKEFMILEYLAKHAGEVVTRTKLLDHVWDMNADPFSNTIEAHISTLRKKLASNNFPKELLRTIPGRGYKLTA